MVDREAAHRALDALLNLLDELEPRRVGEAAQVLWDHRCELIDLVRITIEHPDAVGRLLDTLPAVLGALATVADAGGNTADGDGRVSPE